MFSQIPSCLCTGAGERLPQSEPSHLAGQEVMLRLWCCQQQHPAAPSSRTGSWSQGSLALLLFAKPSTSWQGWQRFQMGALLPCSLQCSCDTLSGVVYSKYEDLLYILAPRLLELLLLLQVWSLPTPSGITVRGGSESTGQLAPYRHCSHGYKPAEAQRSVSFVTSWPGVSQEWLLDGE